MLASLLPEGPVSVRSDMKAAPGEAAAGTMFCLRTVFNVSKKRKKKRTAESLGNLDRSARPL